MAGTALSEQLHLYDEPIRVDASQSDTASTFADNLALPIHRWFRYSAGFSATWARQVIEEEKTHGRQRVFDPFAGSGTAVIEGEAAGLDSLGIEAHPFVFRIASAKLLWRIDSSILRDRAELVLMHAKKVNALSRDLGPVPKLLKQCYPEVILRPLLSLREACESLHDNSPVSELIWLGLMAILRECSPVGTAQWQYVLPNKVKARAMEPFTAFLRRIMLFAHDMERKQKLPAGPPARILYDDARECTMVEDRWADIVLTSPPYANNYDYADATRLEMTFAGEIDSWADLKHIRSRLVRSCSQHAASVILETDKILSDTLLQPISSEITNVCARLSKEREYHGGKKPYHSMIAAYFHDMARVWIALRRITRPGARICFVIGDSAPYGVYVPVQRWMGELALAAGFDSYKFEKMRDRNVKWKNRKHRVPLQEGRLWVEG